MTDSPRFEHAGAFREAATLALYMAIVLLAILAGFGGESDTAHEVGLIWGTAIGLGLAHLYAYELVSVFSNGRATAHDLWSIGAMATAVVSTAAVATVPYLVDGDTLGASTVSSLLLVGLIGASGYVSGVHRGLTTRRTIAYTLFVTVTGLIVVWIKFTLTH